MSFINRKRGDKTGKINCKILYYGPKLSGKSCTLRSIHRHLDKKKEGITSLSKPDDKTFFFDFLPLSLGKIGQYEVHLHLYSVPGPIMYDASRHLIFKGVDGIVFVADSRVSRLEENLACLDNLQGDLHDQGIYYEEMPLVFQYNKRDLHGEIAPVSTLDKALNPDGHPCFETVARRGEGVMEPLRELTKLVLRELRFED